MGFHRSGGSVRIKYCALCSCACSCADFHKVNIMRQPVLALGLTALRRRARIFLIGIDVED